jgi:transposase-like protein
MGTTQRRTFTGQFKLETVLEYLRGHKPTAQLCRERDITENLLYRWKQQFYERAPSLFDTGPVQPSHDLAQERIAELERMVGRLTMELDILKKAGVLLTSRSNGNGR